MNNKYLLIVLIFCIAKINALTISFDYNYPQYLDYYYYDYYYPNWQGVFVKPRADNKVWKSYRVRNKKRCKFYCYCEQCELDRNTQAIKDRLNLEAINR